MSGIKKYWQINPADGMPIDVSPAGELFRPEQKERAEQILKAVEGLSVYAALSLLGKCKKAVMQSTVDVD